MVKVANEEYLKEICDKIIGFQNLTVIRILEHLKECRGKLIILTLKKYKKKRLPPGTQMIILSPISPMLKKKENN